jgi:hypothetical protein
MIINIFALKTSKKRQPVLDHLVEKNTEKAPGKPGSAPQNAVGGRRRPLERVFMTRRKKPKSPAA